MQGRYCEGSLRCADGICIDPSQLDGTGGPTTASATADPTTSHATTTNASTTTSDPTTDATTDPTPEREWTCDIADDGSLCVCDTFTGGGPVTSCGPGWSCCLLWADPKGDLCYCDHTDCTAGLADCPECVVVGACPT